MPASTTAGGHVLIVGATGLAGGAAVLEFASQPHWRVTCCSRRKPLWDLNGATHISVDLQDRSACDRIFSVLDGVTHIVYSALYETPAKDGGVSAGWGRDKAAQQRHNDINLSMLCNVVEPVESGASSSTLQHVSVMHGTRAYDMYTHIDVERYPAIEDKDARSKGFNVFYWLQEDWIRDRASHAKWTYTFWRPPLLVGFAAGAPLNVLVPLVVHACILRELGLPLRYHGVSYGPVLDVCDTRLLAKALRWAAEDVQSAAGETFNITNGDIFTWQSLFPRIAEHLGMKLGEPQELLLAEELTIDRYGTIWSGMVHKYGLQPVSLEELLGENAADFADGAIRMNCRKLIDQGIQLPLGTFVAAMMSNDQKIRKKGFTELQSTSDSVVQWIDKMVAERLIPGPPKST